jgi:hypothetical protein
MRTNIVVHIRSSGVILHACDFRLRKRAHPALVRLLFSRQYADIALANFSGLRRRYENMPPISIGSRPSVDVEAHAARSAASSVSARGGRRKFFRWLTAAVSTIPWQPARNLPSPRKPRSSRPIGRRQPPNTTGRSCFCRRAARRVRRGLVLCNQSRRRPRHRSGPMASPASIPRGSRPRTAGGLILMR